MNQVVNVSRTKLIYYFLAASFLVIHSSLLVVFGLCGTTPMFAVNFVSVLLYVSSFLLIRRSRFRTFIVCSYLEVLIHMTLAIVFTGWNNGFQATLLVLSVFAFFAEYLSRSLDLPHVHALPLGALSTFTYLLCYLLSRFIPARWPLPESVSFWMQIAWGVASCVISIACLEAFTLLSFNSEKFLTGQVETDELTGLPNRYYVSRNSGKFTQNGWWVAMLDIDDFKAINDTYGHNFGDEILRSIAQILNDSLPDATACRWGGEEFLLFGCESEMDIMFDRLNRFRSKVERHTFVSGELQIRLTVTIGLEPYEPGTSLDDWINAADKKLYVGKRTGKNKVVL